MVEGILEDFRATNEITKNILLDKVKVVVANENIDVTIENFNLESATIEAPGRITGIIRLLLDGEEKKIEVDLEIAKLEEELVDNLHLYERYVTY